MRGENRKRAILLLAAVIVYTWAVLSWSRTEWGKDRTHLVLDQGIDASRAEEIFTREGEEETPTGFCFWGQQERQSLSCQATGASAQITRVYVAGNPELLGTGKLAWRDGCLIDAETARTLFGTERCGGQSLVWNGTVYPVLGTVSTLRPTAVMTAGAGDILDRCVLAVPGEQGKVLGEQFLMRWGLWGTVLNFFPLWALTWDLLLLAPGILLLGAWGRLGKGWRELSLPEILSGSQLKLLGKTALAGSLAAGTVWLLMKEAVIPPDMIPSRWSDFSFWGRWWTAQKEDLRRIVFTPLGNRQLQMLLNMIKSMGGSTAAALLALGAVRRVENADIADRG